MIPLLQHYGFEISGRSIAAAFVLAVATWVFRTIQELKRRKQQLPFADIPYTVPNPHWLLGHLSLMGNDVIDGQYKVCVESAGGSLGLSTFYALGVPVLSVLDAEAAERILKFTSERKGNPTTVRHFKKMFGERSLLMERSGEPIAILSNVPLLMHRCLICNDHSWQSLFEWSALYLLQCKANLTSSSKRIW
jgi:hypothetical protein